MKEVSEHYPQGPGTRPVDAAVDLLEACRALEAGILDVQAEVDTLEAELTNDEHGREA